MNISLYNLSKSQTTILKGIGIIMIVLHNFIHYTHNYGENEFDFKTSRIVIFFNLIKEDLLMLINGSFSFWGFFGIELFIFVSAYGLVKQFINKKPSSYWKYLLPKIIKIYGLIVLGLICYVLFLYPIGETNLNKILNTAKTYLLLNANFSFDTIFKQAHAGPWWFFSFIIQLYIIFPVLFYFMEKYREKGFWGILIVSYILIYAISPIATFYNFPVYANFIGHLPEFIIGMGFAYFKQFRINYKLFIPVLLVFVLSNRYEYIFPLSFTSSTILMLVLFYPLYNKSDNIIQRALLFIGSISMFMFVINCLIRPYLIIYVPEESSITILVIAITFLLIVIAIAYVISIIYNKFVNPQINKLIKIVSS